MTFRSYLCKPTSKFSQQALSLPHNTMDYIIITQIPQQTQSIEFLCKAKIASLETTYDWYYISCAKCSKKLQPFIYQMLTCFNAGAVGVVWFN
ncbi:hypothetical protein Bca101_009957 [Brassica carinata]